MYLNYVMFVLATSASDETARIWQFLPQSTKGQLPTKESESNYTTTVIKLGNRVGLALR